MPQTRRGPAPRRTRLAALPDLVRRGLASRGAEGGERAAGSDADASLSESVARCFFAKNPGAVKVPKAKAPSTVSDVIAPLRRRRAAGERRHADDDYELHEAP